VVFIDGRIHLDYHRKAGVIFRRLASIVWLAIVFVWMPSVAAQNSQPEYQLKAAFVSKFPEFTEWPESALSSRQTIELCVPRPNPFGKALADLVAGETVRGRALVTREIGSVQAVDTCQLLFVPIRSAIDRKQLLARAEKLPLLTIGDYPSFLDEGGIVNLRVVDGRVRFDIDVAAANRAGVRFSSQLLRLALNVRGGRS
jgi:hypothetical protein